MLFLYLFLLISLFEVTSSGCLSFEILLTQNIENAGFHRDLKWLLEVTRPETEILTHSKCNFMMQLEMPQGAFVNPDQLADLNRIGVLNTRVEGDVNVEVMDHEATKHTVQIYLNPIDKVDKVSITLPFHLRYQRARLTGGYEKVVLPKPSLLVRCSQKEKQICDQKVVSAPCTFDGLKTCRWFNISYKALFDVGEVLVPVGDLDHYPLVSIVTLTIGCVGCFYVLSLLSMIKNI